MWARIQNDTVAEIAETDPIGRHHPAMTWVEVPAAWRGLLATGCRYVEGSFRPPMARDPETGDPTAADDMDWLKTRARAGVVAFAAAARRAAAGTEDLVEVASWPSKEQIALRHQAATATASDLAALEAEAELRDEAVADLVDRILAKSGAYKAAVGKIDGWRQKSEAMVDAATDPAELVADLAAHKATAAAQLAAVLADIAAA